jgi:hypothetical protein
MASPIRKTTKGPGRHYLSTKEGAGMTAAGRKAYNRATGSNLKPPAPSPKTAADKGRKKSFCARMAPIAAKAGEGSRAKASMRRWKC